MITKSQEEIFVHCLEIIVFITNKSSFLFTIFSINPQNNEHLGLKVNIEVGNVLLDQGVQLKWDNEEDIKTR